MSKIKIIQKKKKRNKQRNNKNLKEKLLKKTNFEIFNPERKKRKILTLKLKNRKNLLKIDEVLDNVWNDKFLKKETRELNKPVITPTNGIKKKINKFPSFNFNENSLSQIVFQNFPLLPEKKVI